MILYWIITDCQFVVAMFCSVWFYWLTADTQNMFQLCIGWNGRLTLTFGILFELFFTCIHLPSEIRDFFIFVFLWSSLFKNFQLNICRGEKLSVKIVYSFETINYLITTDFLAMAGYFFLWRNENTTVWTYCMRTIFLLMRTIICFCHIIAIVKS